jgi:hypothetical protein
MADEFKARHIGHGIIRYEDIGARLLAGTAAGRFGIQGADGGVGEAGHLVASTFDEIGQGLQDRFIVVENKNSHFPSSIK